MQSTVNSDDHDRLSFKPLELSIIAGGTARLATPELAKNRKELMQCLLKCLSPQFLRHSDEQTLASLVAISEAIRSANMTSNDFHDWAIVSSPRNLGRSAFAAVIDKYRGQGPWGVSVQVIPHCTAHAVGGTISLALESHGPCIGAGGAADVEIDSLFSAACVLRQPDWFAAWVVFSAWPPELAIDTTCRPASDSMCFAAAIAVTREWSACSIGRICFDVTPSPQAVTSGKTGHETLSASFTKFLTSADGIHRMWSSPATSSFRHHVESKGRCFQSICVAPPQMDAATA